MRIASYAPNGLCQLSVTKSSKEDTFEGAFKMFCNVMTLLMVYDQERSVKKFVLLFGSPIIKNI